MELPADERLLTGQIYLIKQRELAVARKRQLLEQFRAFALNKLKTYGQPFEVKFRSINGNPSLKYQDLDMDADFFLEYGSFTFDPKTGLISDYIRNEFRGTKTEEDFNVLMSKTIEQLRQFRNFQQTLERATELERTRINKMMQNKVDKILMGIFKGELGFNDPEFKALVDMTIAIEQELQELNTRISALKIINSSSENNMIGTNDNNVEIPQKDNRAAIMEFLQHDVDPSLAVVALGQPEGKSK